MCSKQRCLSASHAPGSGCTVRRAAATDSHGSPQICIACKTQVAHPKVFAAPHVASSPGLAAWIERHSAAQESTIATHKRKRSLLASSPKGSVHHLWIELELVPPSEKPCASVWRRVLDDPVAMLCLMSWSVCPQVLWTYSPVDPEQGLPGAVIPGLVLRDAALLMPPGEALSLLAAGMPVQLLKDILSMLALSRYGGIWADLDAFCLRPPGLDINKVYAVIEPHSRHAGLVHGRASERFSLYLMATPANIPLYERLAERWRAKYMALAVKVLTSGTPVAAFATDGTAWMQNTKEYTSELQTLQSDTPDLVVLLHPWQALPFHQNMGLEQWAAMKKGGEHVCRPLRALIYTCPYPVPTWAELQTFCFAINLWSRQWKGKGKAKFVQTVLGDVQALRDVLLAGSVSHPVPCPVTQTMCCMLAHLLHTSTATSRSTSDIPDTPETQLHAFSNIMLSAARSNCQHRTATINWVWKAAQKVHAALQEAVPDS